MKINEFSNAKVLITGHTGFKGSWLSLWLSRLGANVIGVSLGIPTNPSHYESANLESILRDYRIDIRNNGALKELIKRESPDFIFHLAAQPLVRRSYSDPVEAWTTNTLGTINVLEALRELKKPCVSIFITSDKCYDNVEWVWGYRESDRIGGPDPYSASKGAAELAIRSYVRSYLKSDGLVRIGVGRAGNVIGGGDWADDRIVPDCVRSWSAGLVAELRNPCATRPWQHVLEPLSGYINLAMALNKSADLHGEPFNFGPQIQNDSSVGTLVSLMSEYWDQVRWKDISTENSGPYESKLLKLNCDKSLHYLNWMPIWDFNKTVFETAQWYKNYYDKSPLETIDFSMSQIDSYTSDARVKGLKWAQ